MQLFDQESCRLMTNDNVKLYFHDRLMRATFLKLIPSDIKPNHLTVLRVLLTPFILFYLWHEAWVVVVPLFLFAAFTDLLDGSLARTRKQITLWGTIADPIADKLLIGSVVILFVAREINIYFAAVIVFVELAIVVNAVVRRAKGRPFISANWYGKVKMLLQVLGVTALLIARWSGLDLIIPFSVGTLSIAIVFAVLSLYTYGL
ncbi:MAG: CDP-alcohol phosphatidyltransferase family protein [Patescibacteria group bacterium]|nr:CDP-alcohol phosphatidyltransferase family protein [Patescibacteria group bacterium]